ncbi:MAG: acyloxyacyl hydrolase [Acidobacteriaceae bacterium]
MFPHHECKNSYKRASRLSCILLLSAVSALAPSVARGQATGDVQQTESPGTGAPLIRQPVESDLTFEGQGSFGNYQIFAAGTDSKLFTGGVEYDRHSWGYFLGSQVYYVAEFLPFVLLNEPAELNYYGVVESTNKGRRRLVPGIGITPIGIRFLWRDGKAIRPYLMAKGGMLVFTQKALSPNASYENISLQSSVGLQIRLTKRVDLRMGMGDYHFSNAFVVPSNPGLDVMSYMYGISYHFGPHERRTR